MGFREAFRGDRGFEQEWDGAGAELGGCRGGADVEQRIGVGGRDGWEVGGSVEGHGIEPAFIEGRVGLGPVMGVQAGIELLLQGAEIPAFILTGFPGSAQQAFPGVIGCHHLAGAVRVFNEQAEQEAGLSQRVGAVAMSVVEDGGGEDIFAGLEELREVHGVGFWPARVGGGGSPLDAAGIHIEAVSAIGHDPSGGLADG
ncbi:MAG: hypothetical protein RI897_1544 [Verrucomicrobiota bacterium]